MNSPDTPQQLAHSDIIPGSQTQVDSLRFSGLGDQINPTESVSLENIGQMAYNSARRLVENDALRTENSHLTHELNTDPKTGLANERAWLGNLAETMSNLTPGQTISVNIIDIDRFKEINDKYGHAAGDRLLRIVGNALSTAFSRKDDVITHGSREKNPDDTDIARLGGDEFAIMSLRSEIPGEQDERRSTNGSEQALRQAKHLNEVFKGMLADTEFSDFIGLNLSVGYAESKQGDTPESLFARADMNMFQIKYEDKMSKITDDDKIQLKKIIPYLESLGTRVESWLKQAATAA
jgi:diguanylate cyclase (GGDEF)-like protein